MNRQLASFASPMQFEAELATSIVPMLDAQLEQLDETSAELLVGFLARYGEMVRWNCAIETRRLAARACVPPPAADEALEAFALRWAFSQRAVSGVLVGMPLREYVDAARGHARVARIN